MVIIYLETSVGDGSGASRGLPSVKIFVGSASFDYEPPYQNSIDVCLEYRGPSITGFFATPESDEKLAKIVSQIRAIPRPWKALCTVYLTVKGATADKRRPRKIEGNAEIKFLKVGPPLSRSFMGGFNDFVGEDRRPDASPPSPKRRRVSSKRGTWL